jgi:hypothetical protein
LFRPQTFRFGALLGLFLKADLFVDRSLLERLATRVELAGREIAKACAARTARPTGAATWLVITLSGSADGPALLALDHDHVLAAVAEALLDVPRRFGALQAQRLAGAGLLGLVRGVLGLTHACSDLALEAGLLACSRRPKRGVERAFALVMSCD